MLTALQQSLGLIFWEHQWYFVAIVAQKSRVSATESRWRTENARACGDPARTVVGPSRSPGPCLPQSRESRLRCHCDPCPVYNAARWPRALPSPIFVFRLARGSVSVAVHPQIERRAPPDATATDGQRLPARRRRRTDVDVDGS